MPKDIKLACWIISLHPEAENTVKLLADLAEQGLQASIYPAVDGRAGMPALESGERLNESLARVRHRRLLTSGEVGCYLSHLRAVKQAYEQGYDYVCLLEDDVVIEPLFVQVVESLLSDGLDIVRLMALKVGSCQEICRL